MVRQDKITYLVTSFQNKGDGKYESTSLELEGEYPCKAHISEELDSEDFFPGNMINNRVLARIGVISTSDIQETQTLMSEFIPFKRHNLLFVNIEKIGNQLCTAFDPACVDCNLSKICDFYNEKNWWAA